MTDTMTPIIPTPDWTRALKNRFWKNLGDARIRQAIAMHHNGHSYGQIAKALGYESRMGPYWAVNHSTVAQDMRVTATQINGEPRNPEKTHPPTHDAQRARTGEMEAA